MNWLVIGDVGVDGNNRLIGEIGSITDELIEIHIECELVWMKVHIIGKQTYQINQWDIKQWADIDKKTIRIGMNYFWKDMLIRW